MRHDPAPIYLDYAATTPVDPAVAGKMAVCLTRDGCFANPASAHRPGREARAAVEYSRRQVAALVNATPNEIVWTSGATEADNLAIKGVAHFYAARGRHIVTCKTEHKAVLDACRSLESEGYEVTYLTPDSNGVVAPASVAAALRNDTILLSIMHVNNEIGVVQDIDRFGAIARARGVFFHVDAAQSVGKLPIDLARLNVDLMSFSAHKVYGPKGIGALYVRRAPRVRLMPIIHGGGHERGLRSGTLPTHQIVGMGEACRLASSYLPGEMLRIKRLRERLWRGLSALPGVLLNGPIDACVPGILNVSFPGIEGESLLFSCEGLAVSSGSACTSADSEPSYVLRALGRDDQLAAASIRFSLGRFSTESEIDTALIEVRKAVLRLRALSPFTDDLSVAVEGKR